MYKRQADVFLIQSVAGGNVNDMLMELLIATDAAKRASARSITCLLYTSKSCVAIMTVPPAFAWSRRARAMSPPRV